MYLDIKNLLDRGFTSAACTLVNVGPTQSVLFIISMRHSHGSAFHGFLVLSLVHVTTPACPNQCSGHGECTAENVCDCDDGWSFYADCSGRMHSAYKELS